MLIFSQNATQVPVNTQKISNPEQWTMRKTDPMWVQAVSLMETLLREVQSPDVASFRTERLSESSHGLSQAPKDKRNFRPMSVTPADLQMVS